MCTLISPVGRLCAEVRAGSKLRFRSNESFDNVVDHLLPSTVRLAGGRLAEVPLPADFVTHAGCVRNMSYEAVREEVLAKNEGKIVDNDVMLVDTGKFTGRCPKVHLFSIITVHDYLHVM